MPPKGSTDFAIIDLWPFAESVEAGVASAMCSYQRINQTYGCENSYLVKIQYRIVHRTC